MTTGTLAYSAKIIAYVCYVYRAWSLDSLCTIPLESSHPIKSSLVLSAKVKKSSKRVPLLINEIEVPIQ